jgi:hypothetical protein
MHLGQHRGVDGLAIALGVDDTDPVGVAARDLVVALRDQTLQLDALALESVRLAAPDPRRRLLGIDVEQDRQVRPDAAARQVADLLDTVDPKPAGRALIGDARVAEAVADHIAPFLPGRADHLRHQLGTRRAEEQQLGERVELQRRVLEQPADPLARLGAPRLAHQDDIVTKRVGEQLGLRRLSGAVDSLE